MGKKKQTKIKKASSEQEDRAISHVESWLKQAAIARPLNAFEDQTKDSQIKKLVKKGTLGPYRLLEVLGQGGMGIVWRAKHKETGTFVALKTLRFPKAKLSRFIRQEIGVLAKIRHPGIVRIVDEGVVEGLPYYAMELIIGQTLRQWCQILPSSSQTTLPKSLSSWWTLALAETQPALSLLHHKESIQTEPPTENRLSKEKLETFLTVVQRICEVLSFLHGEGLVHRDLKPENILIGANGLPTLVDFGIAHPFVGQENSRERLSIEGSLLGTSEYMSPEQIERKPLDARSDLYSLGVILFELLTGQRPFSGKTPRDILRAHLYQSPPSLSAFAPHLPQALDTLVARLLAKKPQERFGYASDIMQVLENLGAKPWPIPLPKTRSYLYRPRFLGQNSLLATLRERVDLVEREKEGLLLLLGGESGIGKTRLVTEIAKEAAHQKIRAISGECIDSPIRAPLIAFRGTLLAILDQCLEKGSEETKRLLGNRGKLLARYELALENLPGVKTQAEPADLPSHAAKFRLFSYLRETLLALADEKPLLLVLDDLQWADELSLEFLVFLVQQSEFPKNILILGTYRTEELNENLEKVLEQKEVSKYLVERLSEKDIAHLIKDMLALSHSPPRFSQFLYAQSEGNPFFVAELLRLAVEENLLWRDKTGRWQVKNLKQENYQNLSLPHSLQALIHRRLDALSQEGRILVEAAAVLGKEPLLSLLEQVNQRALESLDELFQRQVLESASFESVRFSHDKLREVALAYIDEEHKQLLHHSTALALEEIGTQEPGVLGYHWEQAKEPARAKPYYLKGAKKAQDKFHYQAAEQLYQNYFRLTLQEESSKESIEARNEFGEHVLEAQGKIEQAQEAHTLSLKEAQMTRLPRLEVQSLRLLGRTSWRRGKLQEATQFCQRALRIAREINELSLEGSCLGDLAIIHSSQGSIEAEQLFQQALMIHRKLGNRRLEGVYLANLASLYYNQGKINEAINLSQQTLIIARELNDIRLEGICLENIATLYSDQGKIEDAKNLFQQALQINQEIRNKRSEGVCLGNLASLYLNQGKTAVAKNLLQQALKIHRETRNRRFEGICLLDLAILNLDQGKIAVAKNLLQQALQINQETKNRRVEGACLGKQGDQARWESGEQKIVESFYTEGEDILREVNDSLSLGLLLCSKGHLLLWKEKSAKDILTEVKGIMKKAGMQSQSGPGKKLEILIRAQKMFDKKGSHPLFRGYCIQDIPLPIREFLVKTKQLSKEKSVLPN